MANIPHPRDPRPDPPPDFASENFETAREALIALPALEGIETHVQAATFLADKWQSDQDAKIQTYLQAMEDIEREEADAILLEEQQIQEEKEAKRKEREKKRPKFPTLNSNLTSNSSLALRPAPYALKKLETGEYVELWYFTKEGLKENDLKHRSAQPTDAVMGLSTAGGVLAVQSLDTMTSATKVVKDESLSFESMTFANKQYVKHIAEAGWRRDMVDDHSTFFMDIETHDNVTTEEGQRALVVYESRRRIAFHEEIKNCTKDEVCPLSKWNDTLYRKCVLYAEREFNRIERNALRSERLAHLQTIASNQDSTSPSQRGREGKRQRGSQRRASTSRSKSPKGHRVSHMRPSNAKSPGKRDYESFRTFPPCPVCLSREQHQVFSCALAYMWDKSTPTYSVRDKNGRLCNPDGKHLCTDWQKSNGCSKGNHGFIHECSGCGDKGHGAQNCPRAQKAKSGNTT